MRVILVPVADRPECARALRAAFNLGKRLDASVNGCHIRAHSNSKVTLSSEFSAQYFGGATKSTDSAWRGKTTKKATVAARRLFASISESNGYELVKRSRASACAVWQERVGSPDKVMSIIGPVSDLVVVSRPPPSGGDVARIFMLTALMESGRPVLILPQNGAAKVGRRICIAWNQSIEAMRAVSASMSLLRAADQVTIVSAGSEDRLGPKSQQLVHYLKSWGVSADRVATRGRDVEKELLASYKKSDSDLLLMGAYSKSRWRQIAFGGTSQHILEKGRIPVLMLHN